VAQGAPAESEKNQPSAEALYGLTPSLVRAFTEAVGARDEPRIRRLVAPVHAADKADLLERLSREQRRIAVAAMHHDFDPEILTYINDDLREKIVEQLSTDEVAAALVELEADDGLTVIEDLDEPQQRELLEAIPAKDRIELEEGLSFPEDSAGRLMQRDFIAVPAYWTVGQTIDFMRESGDLPETFYEIFVVDPKHQPVGTLPLSRLLRNKRPMIIRQIMETDFKTVPAMMDQEDVAYLFDQYDLVSAPAVSEDGRLIGVITFDDVVDVIREEAEEDIMHLGGVPETDLYRAALQTARGRFTWLLVNLATAILASLVIYQFDATIEKLIALAVLMPIVASMGGNAGTQTMTVAVRALATKELTPTNALRILGKEVIVGGFNGILFALLMGGISALWYHDPLLGGVLGAAMIINLIVAGFFGLVIPIALERLKIDPAIAAGALLTSVTDVVGFLAFLGLAALILL
jgi:magnesium transporter